MAAVEHHLVRRHDGLILLFTPPFGGPDSPAVGPGYIKVPNAVEAYRRRKTDSPAVDPGYIKGYLPGVRENGGQYTHAAIWSILAFAALGEGDKAYELFTLVNPIHHGDTRVGIHRYKVEPYVVAADVYAEPPHVGRGGWTWYTGSAGWMYRAGLEWILGFRLRGTRLHLDPCIPRAWRSFAIAFRYHSSRYDIVVENPHGVARGVSSIELDGTLLTDDGVHIPLVDDNRTHQVRVVLGS
jgi:cyclic beta-1,2-glucan synthetase